MTTYYALQSERGTDYVSYERYSGIIKIKQVEGLNSDYQDAIDILPTLDDTDWDIIEEDLDELLTADYYVRLAEYCREDRYLGDFRWYALTSEGWEEQWDDGSYNFDKAEIMLWAAKHNDKNPWRSLAQISVIADGSDPICIDIIKDAYPTREQLADFIKNAQSWNDPGVVEALKLFCEEVGLDPDDYDTYDALTMDLEKELGFDLF